MLSHVLEGWTMSKLLSPKAAQLSPSVAAASKLQIAAGIRLTEQCL